MGVRVMGLRDSRVTASREAFSASTVRLDGQRAKVAAAERALEAGRAESEAALRGEPKSRINAGELAGEALRKQESILRNIEAEHAGVAAAHERVLGRGPSDGTVAAHEAALVAGGEDLAEAASVFRAKFDHVGAALAAASKEVESPGFVGVMRDGWRDVEPGLLRRFRQASEGLDLAERFVADLTRGGWRR